MAQHLWLSCISKFCFLSQGSLSFLLIYVSCTRFVSGVDAKMAFKLLELNNMGIYWDTSSTNFSEISLGELAVSEGWAQFCLCLTIAYWFDIQYSIQILDELTSNLYSNLSQ